MQLLVTITKTSLELNEHEKQAVKCFGGDIISDVQGFSSVDANKGLLFSSAVNQVSSGISFWALLEPRVMKILQPLFRWLTWNCEERVTLVKFFIWMESTFTTDCISAECVCSDQFSNSLLPSYGYVRYYSKQQLKNSQCEINYVVLMRCSDKL